MRGRGGGEVYVGLMLSIFSPELDFTNSLLMKRPIGCSYFRPLGAVSETKRSDMAASFFFSLMRNVRSGLIGLDGIGGYM